MRNIGRAIVAVALSAFAPQCGEQPQREVWPEIERDIGTVRESVGLRRSAESEEKNRGAGDIEWFTEATLEKLGILLDQNFKQAWQDFSPKMYSYQWSALHSFMNHFLGLMRESANTGMSFGFKENPNYPLLFDVFAQLPNGKRSLVGQIEFSIWEAPVGRLENPCFQGSAQLIIHSSSGFCQQSNFVEPKEFPGPHPPAPDCKSGRCGA